MVVRLLIDVVAASRVSLATASNREPTIGHDAAAYPPAWPAPAAARPASPLNQRALPTLGRLVREGRVELCSYAEICDGASTTLPKRTLLDLLGEVAISNVEPAIDRAAIDADVFRDNEQPGALQRFCTRLKTGHRSLEHLSPEFIAQLPPTTQRGVADLERFCELAARTRGDHLVDLFHLWTGELAGCSYFLTFDDALATFLDSRVRGTLRRPLECNPIEPEHLLNTLGVAERDPPPASAGNVVDLFGPRSHRPRGCTV